MGLLGRMAVLSLVFKGKLFFIREGYIYSWASQVALVKNPPANVGEIDPWSGRSAGGGDGNPLQYSHGRENPMDKAW